LTAAVSAAIALFVACRAERPGGAVVAVEPMTASQPRLRVTVDGRDRGIPPLRFTQDAPPREIRIEYADAPEAPPLPHMVRVPAGEFTMGSSFGNHDERPARRVYLDSFDIDRTEVTVGQYARFVHETGYPPPSNWNGYREPEGWDDRPVTHVSWHDANQYAEWAGGALPTEAQWEKAARGTDGRSFPWGDGWKPDLVIGWTSRRAGPEDVGRKPEGCSPYGACDMAGNVWEWVRDFYDLDFFRRAPRNHPACTRPVNARVIKGGSWADAGSDRHRAAFRYDSWPQFAHYDNVGFRTVRPVFPPAHLSLVIETSGGKCDMTLEDRPDASPCRSREKRDVPRTAGCCGIRDSWLPTGIYRVFEGAAAGAPGGAMPEGKVGLDGVSPGAMARVPAGRFVMGSGGTPALRAAPAEDPVAIYYADIKNIWAGHSALQRPVRTVEVAEFEIDVTPVTNAEYMGYLEATASRPDAFAHPGAREGKPRRPHYWPDAKWNKDRYPVVGVDWYDAWSFCRWAGKRLPTEAEWEKAARGADGRLFPWGNATKPGVANLMSESELRRRGIDGRPWPWPFFRFAAAGAYDAPHGDGYENLSPVGVFPEDVSPYGVLDMGGQVFEWTGDEEPDAVSRDDGRRPGAGGNGRRKILKGGAFFFDDAFARASYRHSDDPARREVNYYGFRCARDGAQAPAGLK
jgi:formylglycine-generating enzyme required for sulfatase activity